METFMKKIETFIIFETVKKSEVKRFDLGNQPQATVYEHHLFAQSITITKVNLSPLGEKKTMLFNSLGQPDYDE